ncbi:2-polyprenyl-6-methoxyphenol hydroxylase-like FAD-dependent oxidoreductase [Saccharothrix ecbatanensis]|uniref:2-polyprenyl-6-methoxyphenol hydroxylase-like FAD-dependent oxidoreductase n=1 Tax=Saccharothrix ecbatanensis TaxID=1105145 RepID=A0A7W9HHN5_9PSEU|nr:FAD-dependent monooxygenase [Saccharothrix ecbatanensis]MBB5802517.1 2-polyprenyl-6-methoxyphenol hydroxylase-like FAD-dependent oxidoreductase [Saccharothrix ecbatanensis]
MNEVEVDVLVVGGGPVGLSASVEASRHGLSSVLVERHAGTSIFPKARLMSTRTMELVRAWGIQDEVERVGLPREESLAVGVGSSLLADDFHHQVAEIATDAPQSPTYSYICAQDKFEVVLRALAESQPGADVRFSTTMTELTQDASGVRAVVESGGRSTVVRARHAVAADGGRSGVRTALGIGVQGPPPLGHMVSIMFEADIAHLLRDRMCALYFLRSAIPCAVEAVDNDRRWIVQTGYDPADGGSIDDFTDEFCVQIVRSAVGLPDLDVTLIGVSPWLQQAIVAERFRADRVFLAGDAAHVSTPQGGFGMNCGIQDAHNLVWKLAARQRWGAGEALLDSYGAERHPIGERTVEESLRNALITFDMMEGKLSMAESLSLQAGRRSVEGLVLGFHYDSTAVIPDSTPAPTPADPYRTYVPTARPGHRAPHVWLDRAAGRVSTLDVLGIGFTVLTPTGSGWAQAAKETDARVAVDTVEISADGSGATDSAQWAQVYGVGSAGAVLVRPDGHVAWRTTAPATTPDSAAALTAALDTVLAR